MFFRKFILMCIIVILVEKISCQGDDDVGYANDFVDEVLTNFRNTPSMVEEVDPVDIPDYEKGALKIWNGTIYGLSSLYRYGDCILGYKDNVIAITAEVAVRNVYIKLRYKAKVLFASLKGKVEAKVKHLAVKAVLTVKNGKAKIETFKVTHLGKYSIKKISGLSPAFNWLAKLIANAVAKSSKKKIIHALENGAAGAVNDLLSKVDLPFGADRFQK